MPRPAATAAALAALFSLAARAQQIDPDTGTVPEGLTFSGKLDGKDHKFGIVLDANYRWLYDADHMSCTSSDKTSNDECYLQRVDVDAYSNMYGVSAAVDGKGTEVELKYATLGRYEGAVPNYGSRVFVTDADRATGGGYNMFRLLNRRMSFTIDLSQVPAGMNAAVYLVEMDREGNFNGGTGPNAAGWQRGVGYCDAQCPTDLKFVQGTGWQEPGTMQSCCPEMDLFEGNRLSAAMTAHPCATLGQTSCDDSGQDGKCPNPCDTEGADANMFRRFGPGHALFDLVDPSVPIKITTDFIAGPTNILEMITQTFEQARPDGTSRSFTMNITDESMAEQKLIFGQDNAFQRVGGLQEMGAALERGMVLTLAIWSDSAQNMNWLDSCAANASDYSCAANEYFTGPSVWQDAWARAPGSWRGPVDYLPNFTTSFQASTVTLSNPAIPQWMRSQAPFACATIGASMDCSTVPYKFTIKDLEVAPLERSALEPSTPRWYLWLMITLGAVAMATGCGAIALRFFRNGEFVGLPDTLSEGEDTSPE